MKRGHKKENKLRRKSKEKKERDQSFFLWIFFEQKQRDWDKRNKIFFQKRDWKQIKIAKYF